MLIFSTFAHYYTMMKVISHTDIPLLKFISFTFTVIMYMLTSKIANDQVLEVGTVNRIDMKFEISICLHIDISNCTDLCTRHRVGT